MDCENDLKLANKYISLKASSKTRNLTFDISLIEFKKIYNSKKCFYTNIPLIHGHNFSIDRVDNNKGYISGNIVACDKTFNMLKSNLTIKQITLLYKGIIKHSLKKIK